MALCVILSLGEESYGKLAGLKEGFFASLRMTEGVLRMTDGLLSRRFWNGLESPPTCHFCFIVILSLGEESYSKLAGIKEGFFASLRMTEGVLRMTEGVLKMTEGVLRMTEMD